MHFLLFCFILVILFAFLGYFEEGLCGGYSVIGMVYVVDLGVLMGVIKWCSVGGLVFCIFFYALLISSMGFCFLLYGCFLGLYMVGSGFCYG